MAIPRPLLLVLVGMVLAGGAFFATRGASSSDDSTPAKSSAVAPAPAPSPAAAKKSDAAPAKPAEPKTKASDGLPPKVARVLGKKVVVLAFFQRGSADDSATSDSVASLRRRSGVAVFTDRLTNLADYRRVVGSVGISQAPSVVIVGRDKKARVVEGYVDSESLAQQVVDAR